LVDLISYVTDASVPLSGGYRDPRPADARPPDPRPTVARPPDPRPTVARPPDPRPTVARPPGTAPPGVGPQGAALSGARHMVDHERRTKCCFPVACAFSRRPRAPTKTD